MVKVVRTDRELQCPVIGAGLKDRGVDLVLVPDGAGENALLDAVFVVDVRRRATLDAVQEAEWWRAHGGGQ